MYKIRHNMNFLDELKKAIRVAKFAIKTKSNTSKDVKHIGLKSAISNQILKKYRRKGIKKATSVKLTIPGQSVKYENELISIPCLDCILDAKYIPKLEKIKQIEIGKEFAYVSVEQLEPDMIPADRFIGVDCNTTGHCAVVAIPHTGKVYKLGKQALHTHTKYSKMRKKLQKQGKYSLLRQIKSREKNIIRNINHHISKKLVEIAASEKSGIRFEKLFGIRKNAKIKPSFRYSVNSWSYYQLQSYTQYKARMCGIEVAYVAPAYTSQCCSICGTLGYRDGKKFSCQCGHVDHADVNAAFNIGKPVSHCAFHPLRNDTMSQSYQERDLYEGSTDTPHMATPGMQATIEPLTL